MALAVLWLNCKALQFPIKAENEWELAVHDSHELKSQKFIAHLLGQLSALVSFACGGCTVCRFQGTFDAYLQASLTVVWMARSIVGE